jgi:hypothetical protein
MDVELSDEQRFLKEAVAGVVTREAPFAWIRGWIERGELGAADLIAAQQGAE